MAGNLGRDLGGGMAEGASLSSRLLGSVISGGAIGWLLDRWLGTWPWLVVIGTVAGSILGFYWMVLYARESGGSRGADRG